MIFCHYKDATLCYTKGNFINHDMNGVKINEEPVVAGRFHKDGV